MSVLIDISWEKNTTTKTLKVDLKDFKEVVGIILAVEVVSETIITTKCIPKVDLKDFKEVGESPVVLVSSPNTACFFINSPSFPLSHDLSKLWVFVATILMPKLVNNGT